MSGIHRLRHAPRRLIPIDLACNDPDNGLFAHCVEMVQVEDVLELSLCRGDPPRLRDDGKSLRMMRTTFPYRRSQEWFGNWCWNRYWLQQSVLERFLAKLHSTKKWGADMAVVPLGDWWDADVLPAQLFGAWLQANPPARNAA